jgi:hypothetical protein
MQTYPVRGIRGARRWRARTGPLGLRRRIDLTLTTPPSLATAEQGCCFMLAHWPSQQACSGTDRMTRFVPPGRDHPCRKQFGLRMRPGNIAFFKDAAVLGLWRAVDARQLMARVDSSFLCPYACLPTPAFHGEKGRVSRAPTAQREL